jgi:RNA polymerase sigma factor (sigma-70 family)
MKRLPSTRRSRPYMMAMVLGTALSTLGPSLPQARAASPENTPAVADLSRYCTACWRNARLPADSWSDCTQEVFCRLLRTVSRDSWPRTLVPESDEHRELVRAIDAVKKRTQRQKKATPTTLECVADRNEPRQREQAEKRDLVNHVAQELLTSRQQRILQLSFEGWSAHEIGQKLDLPPERISDEKYKAIRKLRSHLAELE